jgi:hypothetical protein
MSVPNVKVLEQELREKLQMAQRSIKEAEEKKFKRRGPDDLSPTELQEEIAYFSGIEEICHSILSEYFDAE